MLWTAKRSVAQPLMPLMEWTPIPICLLPENIGGIWLKCTCEGHWRRQFRELNDLKDRILAALRGQNSNRNPVGILGQLTNLGYRLGQEYFTILKHRSQ